MNPTLYQINTRVWLTELAGPLGKSATLDDIPDDALDELAEYGFDFVWLLSVWQTGQVSQQVSRTNFEWRREFRETLPDLREEDIAGSGFAITAYTVHKDIGGDAALVRFRERLHLHGLKLMLDFVPNHMGLGHPWTDQHPDYFVSGSEFDVVDAPQNFTRVDCKNGDLILAHGRDPYFSGWPDTLQLNYANPALQAAMMGELIRIADQCDALRCDMAMLVLPDVFERTWGQRPTDFWPTAIQCVRDRVPGFVFLAEVYWDMEWTLQQQGFDYAYDKRLYDRLREGKVGAVREHFRADIEYQNKLARFLENHDEPRTAATFSFEVHRATAVISFLSPGLRFFHHGQFEGHKKRISPHLVRGPVEPTDMSLRQFYDSLLKVLRKPVVREGRWQLLECLPAWAGNSTHDCFVVFVWHGTNGELLIVSVNYAPNQSQCHVRLPFAEIAGQKWQLQDQLSPARYEWNGDDLLGRGLYLDQAPWQACVYAAATN